LKGRASSTYISSVNLAAMQQASAEGTEVGYVNQLLSPPNGLND